MRTLIYAFWAFVIITLLWQFYLYNESMTQKAVAHPTQEHYYFYDTNSVYGTLHPPEKHSGVYLQQTAFKVTQNDPSTGSITCHITLMNEGDVKATNVQVQVYPYRGSNTYDESAGGITHTVVDDNSTAGQVNQWVSFPDLDPGQSSTQTAVFFAQPNVTPGPNAKPQILFDAATNAPSNTPPAH